MRLSRAAVLGATVLVVAGGGYAAYAENTAGSTSYRTALVTTGDVSQTLALSGTLSPAGRGDLAFTTSGTVAAVPVAVGQHVKAGQVLARLDPTSLTAAVARAQAQLDSARARLASDEGAQASAASSSAATSTPTAAATARPSSGASGSAGGASTALSSRIRQQQLAVTTSQTAATDALTAAKTALAQEQQVCAAAGSASASSSATSSASSSASASASGSATTDPSGQATDTTSASDTASACDGAIGAVQAAQGRVDEAQSRLQQALDALAATLSGVSGQGGGAGSSAGHAGPASASSASAPSSASTPSSSTSPSTSAAKSAGSSGGAAGSGRTVTAATLAADQASIDSAQASLVTAQQSLAGAILRAPHAGTVGEVDVAAGDSASAGTTAVVVLSPGATDVDLTVTSAQVAELKAGQVAQVTPAGATTPLRGSISRITPVPDSSGDYPVVVTLDQTDLDLPAGGAAAVDVVVGEARGVLTVPTSAITSGTVEVLDGTTVTRTRVTVGVVGTTRAQVSSGLRAGQQVVLADIDAAVPAGGQQSNRLGRFGGTGLGGGLSGFGGGGGLPGQPGGFAVPKG